MSTNDTITIRRDSLPALIGTISVITSRYPSYWSRPEMLEEVEAAIIAAGVDVPEPPDLRDIARGIWIQISHSGVTTPIGNEQSIVDVIERKLRYHFDPPAAPAGTQEACEHPRRDMAHPEAGRCCRTVYTMSGIPIDYCGNRLPCTEHPIPDAPKLSGSVLESLIEEHREVGAQMDCPCAVTHAPKPAVLRRYVNNQTGESVTVTRRTSPAEPIEPANLGLDATEADHEAPAAVAGKCWKCGAPKPESTELTAQAFCPATRSSREFHWGHDWQPVPPAEPLHPETTCERCHNPNVWSWHAPSPLWNAIMRNPQTGADTYSIVCPMCFAELAGARYGRLVWCFRPHDLDVPALWTDSDGRTWDAERCLWVDPAPAEPEREAQGYGLLSLLRGDDMRAAVRHIARGIAPLSNEEKSAIGALLMELAEWRKDDDAPPVAQATEPPVTPSSPEPVPMVLYCPDCKRQHIDRDDHRKHLCGYCGHMWRPFDYRTIGVETPPAAPPVSVGEYEAVDDTSLHGTWTVRRDGFYVRRSRRRSSRTCGHESRVIATTTSQTSAPSSSARRGGGRERASRRRTAGMANLRLQATESRVPVARQIRTAVGGSGCAVRGNYQAQMANTGRPYRVGRMGSIHSGATPRGGEEVMAILTKRLRGKQRAWAINYEDVTGFEPMYQEDFDRGDISFSEFRKRNLRWLENYHQETYEGAERGPLATAKGGAR